MNTNNPPKNSCARLGQWLKNKRAATGVSQTEAANAVGLKQPTLALYESGAVVHPNMEVLRKLAELYHADYMEAAVAWMKDRCFSDESCSRTDSHRLSAMDALVKAPGQHRAWLKEIKSTVPAETLMNPLKTVLESPTPLVPASALLQFLRAENFADGLKRIWVVTPHSQDHHSQAVVEAIQHNIFTHGVKYTYVVPWDSGSECGLLRKHLCTHGTKEATEREEVLNTHLEFYKLDPWFAQLELPTSSYWERFYHHLFGSYLIAESKIPGGIVALQLIPAGRHDDPAYAQPLSRMHAYDLLSISRTLAIPENQLPLDRHQY